MGRFLAILFAVATGAVLYFAFQPECGQGKAYADRAACRAALGDTLCARAFAEAERAARLDYAPFPTQDACLRSFERCEAHGEVVSGWVPVPRATCVSADGKGWPLYARLGQRIAN